MNRVVRRAVSLSRRNSELFSANKNKLKPQTEEVKDEKTEV